VQSFVIRALEYDRTTHPVYGIDAISAHYESSRLPKDFHQVISRAFRLSVFLYRFVRQTLTGTVICSNLVSVLILRWLTFKVGLSILRRYSTVAGWVCNPFSRLTAPDILNSQLNTWQEILDPSELMTHNSHGGPTLAAVGCQLWKNEVTLKAGLPFGWVSSK